MTFGEYRESREFSLEQCALALGLTEGSKGYLSRLANGLDAWPIRLALEVEVWSRGAVAAVELVNASDALLLRAAIDNAKAAA